MAYALGGDEGTLQAGLREDDTEPIIAEASDQVSISKAGQESAGDLPKERIAFTGAGGIVPGLEVVDIDDEEGNGVSIPPGALALLFEPR